MTGGVPGMPTGGVAGIPTGGVPGIPTGGGMPPTENPASSPSSAGTNAAQQQLMQQMLQMFAGGGGGGSATVHTCDNTTSTHTRMMFFFFPFQTSINFTPLDPDPRGTVPVPAGPAECHGLHQPRGQPAGPHCYWRRHQCRYWETAGLTALIKTYSTHWRTGTAYRHIDLTHQHTQHLPRTKIKV